MEASSSTSVAKHAVPCGEVGKEHIRQIGRQMTEKLVNTPDTA